MGIRKGVQAMPIKVWLSVRRCPGSGIPRRACAIPLSALRDAQSRSGRLFTASGRLRIELGSFDVRLSSLESVDRQGWGAVG